MVVYHIFIVSKSGGLIFNYDHTVVNVETEQTFNYPLDIKLKVENKKVVFNFGSRNKLNGKNFLGPVDT